MDQKLQTALVHDVLQHIDAGTTQLAAETYCNPVSHYTSPERLSKERKVLFRQRPLLVGLSCQLPKPGDFLTCDHTGVPQLVVRGEDGTVRAFMNVCRHRGARVAEGHGTTGKRFRCPYHGWNYDTRGNLVGIPDKQSFPGIDRSDCGLISLPATESDGMIWASATPAQTSDVSSEIDMRSQLGGLGPELGSYNLASHYHYASRSLHLKMNWKLVIDTFLEPYHFGVLHKNSISPIFFSNLCLFHPFGPHLRVTYPRRSIESLRHLPEAEWDLVTHTALVYVLFPNTVFVVQADHLEIWRIYPMDNAVDRSVIVLEFLVPEPVVSESARAYWESNLELVIRTVSDEDFPTGEGIQFGFDSGAQSHLTYGRNEPALAYFERTVSQLVE